MSISATKRIMPRAPRVAGRYQPSVGSFLTVRLPGELMRCKVLQVADEHRVLIEIDGVPMSKSHQYRTGDRTGARRRIEYGREIWEALDDRDWMANRSPDEPVQVEVEKPKRRKKAA